ncbi:helix-turn-helix transcriptional regulator [Paenibacillus hodogayensis]|uniref:Helix-turn-helix transcriptional regulator n=1 Tax=Paenibacillus hodogayensis TaxID=279208 RepID=A0ABV5VZU3_9BACL
MGAYPITVVYQDYWKEKPRFIKAKANEPRWLMFAVEEGRFSYRIDDVSGEAVPGDIVLCPPGLEFQREVIEPLTFHYFIFYIHDTGEGAETRSIDLLRSLFSFKYTSSEQERLFNNYRLLNRLIRTQNPQSKRWVQHFVNDMWALFHMDAEQLATQDRLADDRLMKEARALIDQHAFREVRLQDIAGLLHIHPVQLSRRFQHVFGISPSRYLIAIRMEKAKTLLVQTEYTLDHVAKLCGYENGFYFSRVFTHYSKMNPSQYRKMYSLATL